MPPFSPEHGDIYTIGDRKQLAYSLNGVNYSIQPNGVYTAGQAITKGFAVSIGNQAYATLVGSGSAGNVFLTQEGVTEKTVGIALNSATTGGTVETIDRGICAWPVYYTIGVTGTTSGTFAVNGVNYTPASVSTGQTANLIDNMVTAYNLNPRPDIYFYKFSSTVIALYWVGADPTYTFSVANATSSAPVTVFLTSDIGNTAYITPVANPTLPNQQFTTDRNYAVSTGKPPIEIGIVTSTRSIFIDFEGDSRGAANLSQVSSITGEAIVTNNAPKLVSLGIDGKVYLASKLKSFTVSEPTKNRQTPLGFLVGGDNYDTTVTIGTNVVIQKAGVVGGFTGLTPGVAVYLDSSGGYTQNLSSLTPYNDITTPVGFAFSATEIYVEIGFNNQFSDTADIGTMIAMKNATPDSGYVGANGNTVNVIGATTAGFTGVNTGFNGGAGLIGQDLFSKIGTAFGGNLVYTVTGTCSIGQTLYVNGTLITTSGTTAVSVANQIIALASTQTGFVYSGTAPAVNVAVTTGYNNPSFVIGTATGIIINITGGTFKLPNISLTPNVQIKYNNWYITNSPTPLYRVDSEWVSYPTVPKIASGSSGSIATGGSIDIPLTSFGSTPLLNEIFAEIYVKNASGTNQKKMVEGIYGAGNYGYQLELSTAGTLTIKFGTGGLAFNTTDNNYTPIDNTYSYRVIVYKTERYNKFYDYTSDQWLSQLKSLNLVDYTISTSTQGIGRLDLGAVDPSDTTSRLNYSGKFYASTVESSGALTSKGNSVRLKSNGNFGTTVASSLSFDRTWTYPDTPGEILVAGATQVTGYFDRSITTPNTSHTTRLNYDGNLYVTGLSTTNDASFGNNVNVTGGVSVSGATFNPGYLTRASAYGRPTTTNRMTYAGKLVATGLEARTITGEVINAINENGNFDLQDQTGVLPTNWIRYANGTASAVPAAPGYGSGGSPNVAVTFLTNSTSPISGSYSAILTKDLNPRQGEGISTTFSLPSSFIRASRWLKVSFDYKTSGTFAQGDIVIYVVGVTNNAIIATLSTSLTPSSSATTLNTFFQPDGVNSSYRLCFHVATTSASSYSLELSQVKVALTETTARTALNGMVSLAAQTNPFYVLDANHGASITYSPVAGNLYFQKSSTGKSWFGGAVDLASTLDVAGEVAITNSTSSTTTATGALKVSGGVGIVENLNVGGTAKVAGVVSITNTTVSSAYNNGALIVSGGIGVALKSYFNAGVSITGATSTIGGITVDTTGNIARTGATGEIALNMVPATLTGKTSEFATNVLQTTVSPSDQGNFRILVGTGNSEQSSVKNFASFYWDNKTAIIQGAGISGNSATTTKLKTAVTINGVSFDGSGAITVASSLTTSISLKNQSGTEVASLNSGSSYTLNKNDVGLGSVDNTSDYDKNVATARLATDSSKLGGISLGTSGASYIPYVSGSLMSIYNANININGNTLYLDGASSGLRNSSGPMLYFGSKYLQVGSTKVTINEPLQVSGVPTSTYGIVGSSVSFSKLNVNEIIGGFMNWTPFPQRLFSVWGSNASIQISNNYGEAPVMTTGVQPTYGTSRPKASYRISGGYLEVSMNYYNIYANASNGSGYWLLGLPFFSAAAGGPEFFYRIPDWWLGVSGSQFMNINPWDASNYLNGSRCVGYGALRQGGSVLDVSCHLVGLYSSAGTQEVGVAMVYDNGSTRDWIQTAQLSSGISWNIDLKIPVEYYGTFPTTL